MKLPRTFDAVINQAYALDLYQKLLTQLKKDFLLSNIDLVIDESVSPENLKIQLHETMFNSIQKQFNDYLNLLYIIDVPEEKVKLLDGSDVLKLSESITFLILQREWQKVWYKYRH